MLCNLVLSLFHRCWRLSVCCWAFYIEYLGLMARYHPRDEMGLASDEITGLCCDSAIYDIYSSFRLEWFPIFINPSVTIFSRCTWSFHHPTEELRSSCTYELVVCGLLKTLWWIPHFHLNMFFPYLIGNVTALKNKKPKRARNLHVTNYTFTP